MTLRAKQIITECKTLKAWGMSDATISRIVGLPTAAQVRRLLSR